MKVILKQQVKKVGEKNDICKVRDGYARNFLLPKKMAILATENNIKDLKKNKKNKEKTRNTEVKKKKKKLKKKK